MNDIEYARAAGEQILARFGDRGPRWRVVGVQPAPHQDGLWVEVGGDQPRSGFFATAGPRAEAVALLANQLQDHAVEEAFGEALPHCPGHQHPLTARVVGGNPLWVCPGDVDHHREPVVESDFAAALPALFAPQRWDWGGIDATFTTVPPAPGAVTNVHGVCRVGDGVVVCRDDQDRWFLPGGTLEPGETWQECAERELLEEAGARVTGHMRWLGVHNGITDRPTPYRPHLPHPELTWLWVAVPVVVDGLPTNPPDGEQVAEVRVVAPDEAISLLALRNDWLSDLVRLAELL
ncbi:NUDIX hydrolase [Actinokineospora sp. G85]|uniref:NUDIX hydrolase n=1 Tax=Actinokineospora sp. G85 TaxID=3406626 RepID=UPI003C76031A